MVQQNVQQGELQTSSPRSRHPVGINGMGQDRHSHDTEVASEVWYKCSGFKRGGESAETTPGLQLNNVFNN